MLNKNNITSTSEEILKCGICWDTFEEKDKIAIPEQCENHLFCFECLKYWAKHNRSCPLDRKPFTQIYVYNCNEDSEDIVYCINPIKLSYYLASFCNEYMMHAESQNLDNGSPSYLEAITRFRKEIRWCFNHEHFLFTFLDYDGNFIEEEHINEYIMFLERFMT